MKRQPVSTNEIIAMMTSGEHLPTRVDADGDEVPTSDLDRLENHAKLVDIAQDPTKFRTRCIACQGDVALLDCALCECGGLVCVACQAREIEDECDHEMRSIDDVMRDLHEVADEGTDDDGRPLTMAAHWQRFRREVLSHASDEDLLYLESLYYAGAFSLLGLMNQLLALPEGEVRRRGLRALRHEMVVWIEAEQRRHTREDTPQ